MNKKIVIPIPEWAYWANYESPNGPSLLCNSRGTMCCLGHLLHQNGIPKDSLLGKLEPPDIEDLLTPELSEFLTSHRRNTHFTNKAIELNDDVSIDLEHKMSLLVQHFDDYGLALEFQAENETTLEEKAAARPGQ